MYTEELFQYITGGNEKEFCIHLSYINSQLVFEMT